jgi:hypothetical protein
MRTDPHAHARGITHVLGRIDRRASHHANHACTRLWT